MRLVPCLYPIKDIDRFQAYHSMYFIIGLLLCCAEDLTSRFEARGRQFFSSANEDCHSGDISANHMARILSTSYKHVYVHTRTVNVCAMLMIAYVILKYAPYDWLKYRGMAILVCRKKIRSRASDQPKLNISILLPWVNLVVITRPWWEKRFPQRLIVYFQKYAKHRLKIIS